MNYYFFKKILFKYKPNMQIIKVPNNKLKTPLKIAIKNRKSVAQKYINDTSEMLDDWELIKDRNCFIFTGWSHLPLLKLS